MPPAVYRCVAVRWVLVLFLWVASGRRGLSTTEARDAPETTDPPETRTGDRARKRSHRNERSHSRFSGSAGSVLFSKATEAKAAKMRHHHGGKAGASHGFGGSGGSAHCPTNFGAPPTVITGLGDSGTRGAWLAAASLGLHTANRANGDNICFHEFPLVKDLVSEGRSFDYNVTSLSSSIVRRSHSLMCQGLTNSYREAVAGKSLCPGNNRDQPTERLISSLRNSAATRINAREHWGFKNPRMSTVLPFVQETFGSTFKVLLVIRDGRDRIRAGTNNNVCAQTWMSVREAIHARLVRDGSAVLAMRPFPNELQPSRSGKHEVCNPLQAVLYWDWFYTSIEAWLTRELGPARSHILRIEDLVLNTPDGRISVLKSIAAFLETPPLPPKSLARLAQEFEGHEESYGARDFYKLEESERSLIEAAAGATLRRHEYS